MKFMFYSCKNLLQLNLSSFKTEKCENFMNIFGECNKDLIVYINPNNNSRLIKKIENYVNINYTHNL